MHSSSCTRLQPPTLRMLSIRPLHDPDPCSNPNHGPAKPSPSISWSSRPSHHASQSLDPKGYECDPRALYPPPRAPPAGPYPQPVEKPVKDLPHTGKQSIHPQRDIGSNPITESNIKQQMESNRQYASAMCENKATTETQGAKASEGTAPQQERIN
ncbi:hypothetical protein F511_16568 [Dorcoceras hygrometricum]|uniref:Uncharacterized protein n=1 Tax=Dorcoceras hygrometricum TaxID=472368 RepID=A0A2Z7AUB3_9LAMI|nr:hypothetical protein F511_16568 [Dorcoceras hygrometricum]